MVAKLYLKSIAFVQNSWIVRVIVDKPLALCENTPR